MIRLIGSLLALGLCFSATYAQNPTLDSLANVIRKHPAKDTVRVSLIMDYVEAAVNENTTLLLPYLNEVISISKDLHYKPGIQTGYMTAQIYFSDRGDFARSILYADTCFQYMNQDTSKRTRVNVAYLHANLGGDYMKMGDYQQAIDHYTQAASLLEKYKPENVATAYTGMAEVYEHLLQPEKAMEYDKKAIAAAERSGNKRSITRRYMNYIVRHINLRKFNDADSLLRKIQPMVMEAQDSYSLFLFYQNRGYVRQDKKDYVAAIQDYRQANQVALINDDTYQQVTILSPLTQCLMDAGNMKEAKQLLDTLLAKSIAYKMHFGRLNAYSNLAKWYAAQNDYKTANDFLQKKMLLSDSVTSDDQKEKIALMETRFKVQGKDNEIKILQVEKQNQQLQMRQKDVLNYLLIGGAGALLIISLLFYRNYRNKQKLQQQRINELETEKLLAATEAVLKGEEQERARLAQDLHDGLGGMLSGIKHSFSSIKGNLIMTPDNQHAFERSMDMLDSSIKEMRRVAHNMMPEVLVRYGLDTALRDFCSDINNSGALKVNYQSIGLEALNLEQTTAIALYRIAQELVNNTIRHAGATQAIVQLAKTDNQLSLTVEDDGKGFDPSQEGQTRGIGWRNIRNRIEFLRGRLDVQSSAGNGSSVLIEINI